MISLKYTKAKFVQDLFKGNPKTPGLIAQQTGRFPYFNPKKSKKKLGRYFSETTRVTALPRTNQIAILGKKDAVARVKEFIEKYIDIPLDPEGTAKTLIHVYDLKFLDAQNFKKVLDRVIKSPTSQARGKTTIAGMDFSKVIIAAEQEVVAKTKQGGTLSNQQQDQPEKGAKEGKSYVGGNRLIIAAREREWQMIKGLIEQLDTPQPQVALDVLIVDLTLDDIRSLGVQLRNQQLSPFFKNVNFQSAHLANP